MHAQRELFERELVNVSVTMLWTAGEGCVLTVSGRLAGRGWAEGYREVYENLSVAEMLDVLSAELGGFGFQL